MPAEYNRPGPTNPQITLLLYTVRPLGQVKSSEAADIIDITQHPERNSDLGQSAEDCSKALRKEECSRWDFHVMAQFHIHCEKDSLTHDISRQDLKTHVRQRSTRKHVPTDKFAKHIELISVYVRYTLDQTAGDHIDCRDDESEKNAIDRQLSIVHFYHGNRHGHDDDDGACVPVPRRLFVGFHESSMDV